MRSNVEMLRSQEKSIFLLEVGRKNCEQVIPLISKAHFQCMSGMSDWSEEGIWDQLQLEYVKHYIIFNSKFESVGIIRVVQELNDVISIHGAGWGQSDFLYSKAWKYLIGHFSSSKKRIKSYCQNDNFMAIHALLRSGFNLTSTLRIKDLKPKLFFELDSAMRAENKLFEVETNELSLIEQKLKLGDVHFRKRNLEYVVYEETVGMSHFEKFGKRLLSIPSPVLTIHSCRNSSFTCLITVWPNSSKTFFVPEIFANKEMEIAYLFEKLRSTMGEFDRLEVENPPIWLGVYLNSLFYHCGVKDFTTFIWQL